MRVHVSGNRFAQGPDGVWPEGAREFIEQSVQQGDPRIPDGWNYNPVQGVFPDMHAATVKDLLPVIYTVRQKKIEAVEWAVNRHQREMCLSISTTLSNDEFLDLQGYIQALCDLPATLSPDTVVAKGDVFSGLPWPTLPQPVLLKVAKKTGGWL